VAKLFDVTSKYSAVSCSLVLVSASFNLFVVIITSRQISSKSVQYSCEVKEIHLTEDKTDKAQNRMSRHKELCCQNILFLTPAEIISNLLMQQIQLLLLLLLLLLVSDKSTLF